jgi:hypothetical protein
MLIQSGNHSFSVCITQHVENRITLETVKEDRYDARI